VFKTCNHCNKTISLEFFNKRTDSKDGYDYWCKTCKKLYTIKNIDKIKIKKKEYILRNKDKITKTKKEWVKNNKQRVKDKSKDYIVKNKKELCFKKNQYNKKVRSGKLGYLKQLKIRIRNLISYSVVGYSYTKTSKVYELLGCTYEDLLIYLGPKPEGNYHLDHICPCSQAQNEEELIKLQHYTNFRWLKAEDNISKSDKITKEAEEMCKILLKREPTYAILI
jgi:hypothetical protein